jgi:hypothetical protein
MSELNSMHAYLPSLGAMTVTGLLILVQLIIADISAIKAKHRPGMPLPADAKTFVFRAARAHANSNESVACFILFIATGILAPYDVLLSAKIDPALLKLWH